MPHSLKPPLIFFFSVSHTHAHTHSRSMVMEWWPFEDEGLVGSGSIGSPSYQRGPVTARLIRGQALILICAMATVMCRCNGPRLSTWIWCGRAGAHMRRGIFLFLFCFLFWFRVGVYSAVLQIAVLSVCGSYTAKRLTPPLCAAPLWQWYTVGFLRATGGGWVHTVNYTSSPLVWFIALITVGSLKKEKGEEAYKIKKKRLKVPRWQREGELCASACGGCRFARAWHCLLL